MCPSPTGRLVADAVAVADGGVADEDERGELGVGRIGEAETYLLRWRRPGGARKAGGAAGVAGAAGAAAGGRRGASCCAAKARVAARQVMAAAMRAACGVRRGLGIGSSLVGGWPEGTVAAPSSVRVK